MSDAQEAVSPKSRGKTITNWVGWLEMNAPEAVTLEEYRRLRAEGDLEQRQVKPRRR